MRLCYYVQLFGLKYDIISFQLLNNKMAAIITDFRILSQSKYDCAIGYGGHQILYYKGL